jgi:hypothetical protein
MNNTQKAILLLGIAQYEAELLEELMEEKALATTFTFGMKRTSKDFIKYRDRLVNAVCLGADNNVKEQVADIYKVVSELIEEIKWEKVD